MLNMADRMHNLACEFAHRQAAILLEYYYKEIEQAAEDGKFETLVCWAECHKMSAQATKPRMLDQVEQIAYEKLIAEGFSIIRDVGSWRIIW